MKIANYKKVTQTANCDFTDNPNMGGGILVTNIGSNSLTLSGTGTGYGTMDLEKTDLSIPANHKILFIAKSVDPSKLTLGVRLRNRADSTKYVDVSLWQGGLRTSFQQVDYDINYIQLYTNPDLDYTGCSVSNLMLFDLTQDFGEGNEPSTLEVALPHYGEDFIPYNPSGKLVTYYNMADKKYIPRLPNEYQEVEYIESDGTQYINTGIIPTTDTGMSIDFAYTEISADVNAGISGIYQATEPRTDTFFISTQSGKTNSYIELFHRGITFNTNIIPTALSKYNVKINWLNDGKANFNDGTKVTNVGNNQVVAKDIVIFGRLNNANDTYSFTKARCYGVEFSEGSKIIRDLIPCYRKSDNVAGMYDLIEDEFYINDGMGTFNVGDDVDGELTTVKYDIIDKRFDGVVDLGSLRWDYASGGKFFFVSTSSFIPKPKGADADKVANVYCSLYEPVSKSVCENPYTTQKCISITNSTTTNPNRLSIKNIDYTVASEFKSAMSGVMLWYQTDTQTEIIR